MPKSCYEKLFFYKFRFSPELNFFLRRAVLISPSPPTTKQIHQFIPVICCICQRHSSLRPLVHSATLPLIFLFVILSYILFKYTIISLYLYYFLFFCIYFLYFFDIIVLYMFAFDLTICFYLVNKNNFIECRIIEPQFFLCNVEKCDFIGSSKALNLRQTVSYAVKRCKN